MTTASADAPGWITRHVRARPLSSFFLLAFWLSWAWNLALLAAGATVTADPWPSHLPSLFGPAIAAFVITAITAGRSGTRALGRAIIRWRIGARWWLITLAPPLAGALTWALIAAAGGDAPHLRDLGRFSGTPHGVAFVVVAVLLSALGEETGWRGFALPRLQSGHGALRGTFILAALWALWHVPMFFLLSSYGDFGPVQLVGFAFGLTAGALVLTWLYDHTGGSVLAVTVWHAGYNLAVGTAAGTGATAAVVSTLVIVWGIAVIPDLKGRREVAGGPAGRDRREHAPRTRGPAPAAGSG